MEIIKQGRFIKPTQSSVESVALGFVREEFGADAEVLPEDFLGMFYRMVGRIAYDHIEKLEDVYFSFFYNTASGQQLDDLFFPNSRVSGAKAVGEVRLTFGESTTEDIIIIGGTEFMSVADITYATQEDVTIPTGSENYSIVVSAEDTGVDGNVPAGATFTTPLTFSANHIPATITNPSAITGGANRESDDDYRKRALRLATGLIPDIIERSILAIENVDHARIYINATDAPDANSVPAHGYELVVRTRARSDSLDQLIVSKMAENIEPWVPSKQTDNVEKIVMASNNKYKYFFTRAKHVPSSEMQVTYDVVVSSVEYLPAYDEIIQLRVIQYLGGVFTSSDGVVEAYDGLVGIGGRLTLPSLQGLIFELETESRIAGVYTITGVSVSILGQTVAGSKSTYKLARDKFLSLTNSDITISKTEVESPPEP